MLLKFFQARYGNNRRSKVLPRSRGGASTRAHFQSLVYAGQINRSGSGEMHARTHVLSVVVSYSVFSSFVFFFFSRGGLESDLVGGKVVK